MKKLALFTAAIVFAATPWLTAADKTWDGVLSDARCNGKHAKAEHGSQEESDNSCVTKCVAGGGKYVFISEGKTYQIANQDFKDLKAHGGHKIALTGEMKGEAITVSKIEMPKKEGAKK